MSEFEYLGLKSGIWQGVIHRDAQPGRLVLVHMGSRVAEARLAAEAPAAGASPPRSRPSGCRRARKASFCSRMGAPRASRPGPVPAAWPA